MSSCSSATPSAPAAAASPAALCAATTASPRWPPWPGGPCPSWRTRAEVLGAPSGYRRTGYLVGVGIENLGALRANVAMHQRLGIEVELVGHDTARELWPAARLDDFAEFAYEPRGGYGDGHQTALAFAAAARHGGADLRQHCGVAALDVAERARAGRRPRRRQPHRCRPRRPGGRALVRRSGRRRRRRPARAGPAGPDPPRRPGSRPRARPRLLRPGVAAVRTERGILVHPAGRQRPLSSRMVRPRSLPGAGQRRRAGRGDTRNSITGSRASTERRSRRRTLAATT